MRRPKSTKTIIARIWLVLAVVAVVIAPPILGRSSAHRYYYMQVVEYNTKIKVFNRFADYEVFQSFVEEDDPDGYTQIGSLLIGKYPNTEFALFRPIEIILFRPWVSSIGVSQIYLNYNGLSQTRLTQSELAKIVLAEAALNINSSDPLWEFEQMESRGFLNLIANNPTPITKFHPENIAADLLTLVFIAGSLWSAAHLIRRRILAPKKSVIPTCSHCGYSRDGLDSITQCPECGEHFKIRTFDNSI